LAYKLEAIPEIVPENFAMNLFFSVSKISIVKSESKGKSNTEHAIDSLTSGKSVSIVIILAVLVLLYDLKNKVALFFIDSTLKTVV
jgi:hypothetical protein